ncbi:hypothetical protein OIDMADRAFT_18912 [Oidiodendron maius Zn]|uniref:Ribophorin II C-terminal domain-containing protein n=1 Tax=Oidiodendron maius (strain Zn) TaxID=913774 RepID=A0A0C3HGR3_OIDMZ|nr:hypothetical protein OIDMADRAFT_18912 [Oidiodendron maius Zn]
MRFLRSVIPSLLLIGAGLTEAASSWSFVEGSISVNSKTGDTFKDKLSHKSALKAPVSLGATDGLKIILTATEDGKGKQPHQAFLLLRDPKSGLEATFPFSVKDTGKAKVDVTQKDLPVQLLSSEENLQATLLLASFGASKPYGSHVFDIDVKHDPNLPKPKYEKPLRYGKLEEIHHIFRADPKSGPMIISIFFALAVLATVPALLGTWIFLGANVTHLTDALSAAPLSHGLFFGSIVLMEGIFFLYYYNWTLFQVLPVAGVVGLVAFLSGSKALSEVQTRRLAGKR